MWIKVIARSRLKGLITMLDLYDSEGQPPLPLVANMTTDLVSLYEYCKLVLYLSYLVVRLLFKCFSLRVTVLK